MLPSASRKAIQISLFLGVSTSIGFFAIASAMSIDGFLSGMVNTLGIVKAEGKNGSSTEIKNDRENVQNIKVFEAEKNLKSVSLEKELPKTILNNQNVSLEIGKDNFYAGENLNNQEEGNLHSDNAIYKVLAGESIYSIASYFGITAETILSYNKISEKEVKVGMVLEIPPTSGINYEIKKGDTLTKLAKKYNLNIDDLTLTTGYLADEELDAGEDVFLAGAKEDKKEVAKSKEKNKSKDKNKNLAKNTKESLGNLAKYLKNMGAGSTSQFNKISDIKKYFNLTKYNNYYTYPAPGTTRTQTMHGHNGCDLAGPTGTAILAAAGGTVKVAKSSGYNFGFGNYVIIAHSNGTETVYGHMSSVKVSVGQQVGAGQNIGAVGSSGNSTGAHLHFEIRGAYNPWAW